MVATQGLNTAPRLPPHGGGNPGDVLVDVLVVGAGPAGGALGSFLGFHGVNALIISRDNGTAKEPRAHYTNPGALECLRDIGIEDEFRAVSTSKDYFVCQRMCWTLAGKDLLQAHSFGRHPHRLGDYETISPCAHADIPQNVAEPILIKYAAHNRVPTRFNCKFLSSVNDETSGLITSTVEDLITGTQFRVISKYLCGADGANSRIARQLDLPFHHEPSGGTAVNVWYEADLSHLYRTGPGLLHSCFTPDIDTPSWGTFGVNRIIRVDKEYLMVMLGPDASTFDSIDQKDIVKRLHQLIGDDSVKVKIKGISTWNINESYAKVISSGNVFCLGDAIHRHPPGNALGSNTCIQDAYNLAWKLAYVLDGRAGPALLDTYNAERQPIAKRIVKIANDTVRMLRGVYGVLGIALPTVEQRLAAVDSFTKATPEGVQKRKELREAYASMEDESTGLGGEMNQKYNSAAIVLDDEKDSGPTWEEGSHGVRHHTISTYPGFRLPHAWLGTKKPGEKVSTHDLAGHGRFTLFTGIIGGQPWQEAAKFVTEQLPHIEIKVITIGPGQEYLDYFYMWADRSGVEESGMVLARPDRTVAWRSNTLPENGHKEKLLATVKQVLCL